jgi:hypothetical protein
MWHLVNDIHTKFDEISVLIQEYTDFSLRKGIRATSNILKLYTYQLYYCMNCTDFDHSFAFSRNQFRTYALVLEMCTCISSTTVL